MHSVARFIVGCHFLNARCACSPHPRASRSVPSRPHHTFDQLGSLVPSELKGLNVNTNAKRASKQMPTILRATLYMYMKEAEV